MGSVEPLVAGAEPTVGRGLERTRAGRVVIGLFVTFVVLAMVLEVVPASIAPGGPVQRATHRYIEVTGTWQPWRVFSPPRNAAIHLEARLTFDDGTTTTWHPPRGNPLFGSYVDYHWAKYAEHAARQDSADEWRRLWEPLARFLARGATSDEHVVTSVTLITRTRVNPPLDAVADAPDQRVDEYFTLQLAPGK